MVRRLRTLSGCLTCRRRRKKCDETRPQCGLCERLELSCVWKSNDGTARHECMLPKHQYRLLVHGKDFQPELTARCSSWIASTLSPLAMAQWRSAETLMTELQRCRVACEAIAAFAATIVTHEEGSDRPTELELKSQSLERLRRDVHQFTQGDLQHHSLPALIISVFLLAFTEVSCLPCASPTTGSRTLMRGVPVVRQGRLSHFVRP